MTGQEETLIQEQSQENHTPAETDIALERTTRNIKYLLTNNLGEKREQELLPPEKEIVGITQENYFTNLGTDEEFKTMTPDGHVYSVYFADGSEAFFTYAKVPASNPWAHFGEYGTSVGGPRDWAVNNTAVWDGKDTMLVEIPVGEPTKKEPVVDKIKVSYDGEKTTFETTHPDGKIDSETHDGDLAKPEPMLVEWRKLVKKSFGTALPTTKVGKVPSFPPGNSSEAV